ncbi:hypothetical protein C8J56DRAFT_587560 [Mycena floridula]|nr:hypothetical protein C8J56DRAFT_587560 [Mycena floridula]
MVFHTMFFCWPVPSVASLLAFFCSFGAVMGDFLFVSLCFMAQWSPTCSALFFSLASFFLRYFVVLNIHADALSSALSQVFATSPLIVHVTLNNTRVCATQ